MIVVIAHHHCKSGSEEAAKARIDDNGAKMSTMAGFLFRLRLESLTDCLKISTVTGWKDELSCDSWTKARSHASESAESPYHRVENERHYVKQTHGLASNLF